MHKIYSSNETLAIALEDWTGKYDKSKINKDLIVQFYINHFEDGKERREYIHSVYCYDLYLE